MKYISSRDNPSFKALRLLSRSARERRKQGRTVLDGLHLVEAYVSRVGPPLLLAASERGMAQEEIRRLVDLLPGSAPTVFSDALFAEISPVDTPTGLLALVDIPQTRVPQPVASSCIVLDSIQDSGNVGSILRSAAAAGVPLALLTDGCAQVWSPKTLRAAMGAHFELTLVERADVARLLVHYPGQVLATRLDRGESLFDLDLAGPVAWLFGSEGAGLSTELAALAGEAVRIPMPGAAESLNVAAAAAICLFEQVRQRQARRAGIAAPRVGG
jgi:RNA methyltransferase, TrmH family